MKLEVADNPVFREVRCHRQSVSMMSLSHRYWTGMLFVMRRILPLVLPLCFASEAIGQTTWSLPKLKELDQSNAIGRGYIQLSAEETGLLRKLTHRITSACVSDPGPGDPKTAEGIFKSLRVGRVDLTTNGHSALVVQGEGVCMCGAVGNCPFWLLSEGSNPKLLLKARGIQSFSVQKSRAISPFDLVLGSHDSAMETYIQRFRFDGTSYQRSKCATIEWDDETGNRLDPPRFTSARCP
jgi:hypothetical protein